MVDNDLFAACFIIGAIIFIILAITVHQNDEDEYWN